MFYRSTDPQRAIFSVMFLMLILMVAIKLCGMKPLKNIGEKPKDFQEDIHYMGIYGNIYTDHIKTN